MKIEQINKYFSNDHLVEEQDHEIWVDGRLTYTIKDGLEDDEPSASPFTGEPIQTVYITDKGTVQHNHEDGSFYFIDNEYRMISYIDGELQEEDVKGHFDEFVKFADQVMSK